MILSINLNYKAKIEANASCKQIQN